MRWVNPGPGAVAKSKWPTYGCYTNACGQQDSNPDLVRYPLGYRVTRVSRRVILHESTDCKSTNIQHTQKWAIKGLSAFVQHPLGRVQKTPWLWGYNPTEQA